MSDAKADNCVLEGNPLHREQMEILERIGGATALNTVIDDHRRLAFVNFGECAESHLEAVDFVRRYAEVTLPRRFSTVVTSAAGYPLDKTYYQTVKGMVGALGVLEDGGDLIVASECSEGLGTVEYRDAQRRLVEQGPDGFLAGISGKAHADIDEWQTQMQTRSLARGRISLFTEGLASSDCALTGVTHVASVEDAIAESMARHRDRAVALIPEGPYVVPRSA